MKKISSKTDRILLGVLVAVVLVLAFLSLQTGRVTDGYSSEAGFPADFSRVVETTLPSIVKIENEGMAGHPPLRGMGEVGEVPQVRDGTGFFVDRDGLILTNYHVIQGATALRVITYERKAYEAELVGADAFTDVAMIKIKPDFKVAPAALGDSGRLKVGQWVLAMGNPLGLEFFTSAGIVSGFGPPGPNYIGFYDFIQSDVKINPGNSGGPLLNSMGEVVGINNAYLGPGTGIGFAIPINRAKEVMAALRKDGKISRGFLGIVGQPLTAGLAERLGLKEVKGALISDVLEGSPAQKGGIKPGDVVVEFDGRPVSDDRELASFIYTNPAGSSAKMMVVRDGEKKEMDVTLGELQEHSLISQRIVRQCGIALKEVPKELAVRMGIKDPTGLLVLKVIPGCPAYEGGLRFGDVIKKVEGRPVLTVADFYREFSQMKAGSQVLLQVMREGRPLYLTVRQGEAP